MIVGDLFYQFSQGDSNVLDLFFGLQPDLTVYPVGLDRNVFLDKRGNRFKQLQDEVYHRPGEFMLKREAEGELGKRFGQKEAKTTAHKHYKMEEGHVRFLDRAEVQKLQSDVQSLFEAKCQILGDFIYPPGGFRTWHTNKYDVPKTHTSVWAIFFVFAEEEGASFFRFIHPQTGELITALDKRACANIFRVSRDPLVWHCIRAETTTRWSIGFHLPDHWQEIVFGK